MRYRGLNYKKTDESAKKPIFSRVDILLMVAQNPIIHTFSVKAKYDLLDAIKCFPTTLIDFLL